MRRKWKGYFTVEASLIMPLVLFLYLLIILAALFLYCRCAISQDNFLLGMRGAGFTWGAEDYGEVLYGEIPATNPAAGKGMDRWDAEGYVMERLHYKRRFYPFFPTQSGEYRELGESVLVATGQKGLDGAVEKRVWKLNPVEMIRKGRGGRNA